MKFNGTSEIAIGLATKDIKRSVLAPIKNILLEQKGSDSLYDFGAYLGTNVIDITFHCKTAKTKIELQAIMRDAAAWLFPLDRKAKKLELDQDDGLYYMAKVDGSTDLSEILAYGSFTASFVCKIPYKLGAEESKAKSSSFSFTRGSIAYNEIGVSVPIDKPRYFTLGSGSGLLIEEGSPANVAFTPTFASANGILPDNWSERLLSAAGASLTANGIYRATISNFTDAALGYYGIEEKTGSQHVIGLADIWSISVKARVVSGNVQARLRAILLNTAYSAIDTSAENKVTASSEWTELKIENKNYTDQKVLGIRLLGIAAAAGASGVVEFKEPILEFGRVAHTFKLNAAQLAENAVIDMQGQAIPNNYGLAITFSTMFTSSGVQIGLFDHTLCSLYFDASNYMSIYIDAADKKIKCKRVIAGAAVVFDPTPTAPAFTNKSIIKAYLLREGSSFRFYVKIDQAAAFDSGIITDARIEAVYNKIYIGSLNGANYANSVLKDFIFDDQPAPENYLV